MLGLNGYEGPLSLLVSREICVIISNLLSQQREIMKKHIVLFSIMILTLLWLSGCRSNPATPPTLAMTVAPTINAIGASLEQVNQLEAQKDYEAAVAILANLRSEDPTYAKDHENELNEQAAELYIGWGNDLRASAHYLTALEKYDLASNLAGMGSLRTQIEGEVQKTKDLLAEDSGEDGKSLLDAAMAEACYQEVVPSNPLIGSTIPAGETGRILICDYSAAYESVAVSPGLDAQLVHKMLAAQAGTDWLPDDLAATTPGGLRFTLSRLDTYDTVKTCDYANNQGLTDQIGVMRQVSTVMIRDMFTGVILGEKTFDGTNPSFRCPETKVYDENNFTFGQMVDNEKIIAWVRQMISNYVP
jgi:hypothetical protein